MLRVPRYRKFSI